MDKTISSSIGYRFNPFESELIACFLKPKVLGEKLPSNVVEEITLYGPNANPWHVFDPENHPWILSEVSPGKFEKVTYVFVNLTKKAATEKKKKVSKDNYIKKAGCGTWHGQTKRYEIRDCNGDLIGERRFLVFEINDDFDQDLSKVGYWKMREYQLSGINEHISNPCNTVLCKITFDSSKKPQIRLRPKVNNDHPVKSSSKPPEKNNNADSVSSSTMDSGTVDGNQGVSENSEEVITTQTCRDDLLVPDSYMDKAKERCSGPEVVDLCDDEVEYVDISETYEEAITTQTCRDDLLVPDSYMDKEKEGYSGPEVVKKCDEVEYVNISDDEEDIQLIASSPSEQLDNGYPKPVSSDFCWPATYNIDIEKIKKEGGRRDLNLGKTRVQFSGHPKAKEDRSIKDNTTDLGKRKFTFETSCTVTKKLKQAPCEFCCPAKHDCDYQKDEEAAAIDFYTNLIVDLYSFKFYEIRDCNGDLIGEKRFLVFEINDDFDQDLSKVGYWKMHEYQLRGINEHISNPCNTVLCKITFDSSKKPQIRLRPKVNNDHPVKSSSEPQEKNTNADSVNSTTTDSGSVDGYQGVSETYEEAITTQTCRDDLLVPDSYMEKEKEGYSGPEVVEICDDEVEYVDISDDEEDIQVIASPPSEQLDTGYPKPVVSSEYVDTDLNLGKTRVQFSGYPKAKEDRSIKDITIDLRKRKFTVETSCAVTKKLKQAPCDFCCPAKHDYDYQKAEKAKARREELIIPYSKLSQTIMTSLFIQLSRNFDSENFIICCQMFYMSMHKISLCYGTNRGGYISNEEAITTQTCRDDLLVLDSYMDKEKEGYSGPEVVEICDDEVEYVDISETYEEAITAQTCRDDLLVPDTYMDKGKEGVLDLKLLKYVMRWNM
ncbi:hypothetical protein POM88_035558 [Heracleum sosnowskyi]|uniref:NAC domain-containing protein n=1 Tax=Heracleum sosnowskyi TaxID=360622 RepID=A0AAD8MDE0_9APIA|nr:hypothetical protein POM88_035558 [Heracleum sosnowskyi]